jgi:hypothetical protein
MRFRYLLVLLLVFLSGCGGLVTEIPQRTATITQSETSTATLPVKTPSPSPSPSPPPTVAIDAVDLQVQAAGLLPDFSSDIDPQDHLTWYGIDVDVTFDPWGEFAVLEGWAQIRFTNPLDNPLEDFVLMLWPNDGQYLAEMVAGPLLIDGKTIEPEVELDGLVLRAPLSPSLQPGMTVDVKMPFKVEVLGSIEDERKRFGITNGVLIAPTFYPLVPRLIDGQWQAEAAPEGGDTTSSEVSFYQVSVTASDHYQIVTSGVEIENEVLEDGRQRVTFVSGPMRDFALALGSFEEYSRTFGDIVVNAWVLPQHEYNGERILNLAEIQMGFLSDLVGPYPYAELDIVDAPCGFGGIEYPGLIYICSMDRGYLVDPLVHEVAHQWFYAVVGNDQLQEPWLDEAAASYWQVLYYENAVNEERAVEQLDRYRSWIDIGRMKAPIGLGIGEYASKEDYYVIVYYKGALFYDALRTRLGDELFFEFLQTYYQTHRYRFSTSQSFQETAEVICACSLDDLFDLWVYQGGALTSP